MKKQVTRKVGKYEVGRTIGEGTFAKVKFAHNTETGENVAMKVMAKSAILKHRMVDQVSNFSCFMILSYFIYTYRIHVSSALYHLIVNHFLLLYFNFLIILVYCIF